MLFVSQSSVATDSKSARRLLLSVSEFHSVPRLYVGSDAHLQELKLEVSPLAVLNWGVLTSLVSPHKALVLSPLSFW